MRACMQYDVRELCDHVVMAWDMHNNPAVHAQISTVNMGLAVGWSCVLLSFGKKGLRKSLPHSLGEPHLLADRASDNPPLGPLPWEPLRRGRRFLMTHP